MATTDPIDGRTRHEEVALPAPTAWPLIAAFGLSLGFAGLVTTAAVSVVGVVFFLAGAVGWFREVLPHEHEEHVTVVVPAVAAPAPHEPALHPGEHGHRARLPIEIYPVAAGVRGGLAGSFAMAGLALLYGILGHGSIWYPINLLAAAASADMASANEATLAAYSTRGLAIGTVIHGLTSVLVGLLYGVLLPLVPRRPILLGGVIAPLAWSGLLAATLQVVNPTLAARIDWPWFVASQIGFGVVAGLVVARSERVRTLQHVPFAARAGIERGRGPARPAPEGDA